MMKREEGNLTYTIGEIPEFNAVKMQLLNKYRNQFIELNNEERELRNNNDENISERLQEFYERKNKVALEFIEEVNKGEIVDERLGIEYCDNSTDTCYYDKILIDLYNEYDPRKEIDYNDCFVILPPVIAQMEGGIEQLYEFMDKHIKDTVFGDDEEYYNYGGPFAWRNLNEVNCSIQLEYLQRDWEGYMEKYSDLHVSDYFQKEATKQLELTRERVKKIIADDMITYDLTYEQMDRVENIFYSNSSTQFNPIKAKAGLVYLIKTYGEEWIEANRWSLENTNFETLGTDKDNTNSIEEYCYQYSPSNYDKNYYKFIKTIHLEDSFYNRLIEQADNEKIGKYDNKSLYGFIAENPYLSKEQVLEIKEKAQNLQLGEMDEYFKQRVVDNILSNLVRTHIHEEKDIRDMYNGTEAEKRAICRSCSNIPEDIIQNRIDEIKKSDNYYGRNDLIDILKNNQNLSMKLIQEFMDLDNNILSGLRESPYEYIISQKQITVDMMKEIAFKFPYSVFGYVSRDTKPEEVTEIFANSSKAYVREIIARNLFKGTINVKKDTFRKLALDREIPDEVRMNLLEMQEFTEKEPELTSDDMMINPDYQDIRFGGDGPGSFDNVGGVRRYYINRECVLEERGFTDSYAIDAEGRKWARNAYTNFGDCTSFGKFEAFCQEHRQAVAILCKNKEIYESFENLKKRVTMIERTINKEVIKESNDASIELGERQDGKQQSVYTYDEVEELAKGLREEELQGILADIVEGQKEQEVEQETLEEAQNGESPDQK